MTDGATDKLVAVATVAAMFEATTALTAFFSDCSVGPDASGAAFATPDTFCGARYPMAMSTTRSTNTLAYTAIVDDVIRPLLLRGRTNACGWLAAMDP